jgi:hypothetical protein
MNNYVWIRKSDFEYMIKEAKNGNKFITVSEVANVKPTMTHEKYEDSYIQLRMMPKKKIKTKNE